jgi:hypothetical protein
VAVTVTHFPDADARANRNRRTIDVEAGELSDLVAQAQAALIAANSGIFQRGGQLVRIATLERDAAQHGVRRAAGSVVIMRVTRDYLPLALARAADWRRYDKREKGFSPRRSADHRRQRDDCLGG